MFILLALGVIGLVVLSFREQAKLMPKTCEKVHKWIPRSDQNKDKYCYLVCKDCGKIPGEDQ